VSAHYDGLKERFYGVAEGMTAGEYYAAFPDRQATNAETIDELTERALAALREIAASAGDRDVIAVTHGGLIATVLRHASGGSLPREDEYIANCSQQIIEVSDDSIRVIGYNGTRR
jgi:broad specificity phosphatase PhoE